MGMLLRRHYPENQPKPEYSFSKAAAELLAESSVEESAYTGEATGAKGDVLKSDVEDWLKAREG